MGGFTRDEKRLVAGLWALPGFGARAIETVLARHEAGAILDLPFTEWVPEIDLPTQGGNLLAAAREAGFRTAAESADSLSERCKRTRTRVTFIGDPEYPELLATIDRAPQLLFYRGVGAKGRYRRRVAMVGSRKIEGHVALFARDLAGKLARGGLGVVSGAAEGVDTACHFGALDLFGETWAFLGSSIDQIDAAPRKAAEAMLARGGTVFSDFPPGVRGSKDSFPRRNRYIAGASDATIVVRARLGSGALYTSDAALELGRPLFVVPGDIDALSAKASNALFGKGALPCVEPRDVFKALGIASDAQVPEPVRLEKLPDDIGDEAKKVWELLAGTPMDFDTLLATSGLPSGAVSAALTALELLDAVLERPGRVYYRAQ
jgi:DNA processing protein